LRRDRRQGELRDRLRLEAEMLPNYNSKLAFRCVNFRHLHIPDVSKISLSNPNAYESKHVVNLFNLITDGSPADDLDGQF